MEARLIFEGSTISEPVAEQPASEVIESVSEILGYGVLPPDGDPAEGYREMADELVSLSESNMSAAFETVTLHD